MAIILKNTDLTTDSDSEILDEMNYLAAFIFQEVNYDLETITKDELCERLRLVSEEIGKRKISP